MSATVPPKKRPFQIPPINKPLKSHQHLDDEWSLHATLTSRHCFNALVSVIVKLVVLSPALVAIDVVIVFVLKVVMVVGVEVVVVEVVCVVVVMVAVAGGVGAGSINTSSSLKRQCICTPCKHPFASSLERSAFVKARTRESAIEHRCPQDGTMTLLLFVARLLANRHPQSCPPQDTDLSKDNRQPPGLALSTRPLTPQPHPKENITRRWRQKQTHDEKNQTAENNESKWNYKLRGGNKTSPWSMARSSHSADVPSKQQRSFRPKNDHVPEKRAKEAVRQTQVLVPDAHKKGACVRLSDSLKPGIQRLCGHESHQNKKAKKKKPPHKKNVLGTCFASTILIRTQEIEHGVCRTQLTCSLNRLTVHLELQQKVFWW